MDYEFNSQKELFLRVRPALRSKCSELHRLGYLNIKEFDIWKYLIINKWKFAHNLMLSDIVSDIMRINGDDVTGNLEPQIIEENKEHINDNQDII